MVVQNFVAGDSRVWKFDRANLLHKAQAPASAKVEAFVRTADGKLANLEVESGSADLSLTLSSEGSAAMLPGTANLIVRLVDGDYRRTLVVGTFKISANVEDAAFDHRSEAEKCLEQAENALSDFTKGHATYKSYTIGTRSITVASAGELIDLVNYWRNRVYVERCESHGVDPRKMLVEFV